MVGGSVGADRRDLLRVRRMPDAPKGQRVGRLTAGGFGEWWLVWGVCRSVFFCLWKEEW